MPGCYAVWGEGRLTEQRYFTPADSEEILTGAQFEQLAGKWLQTKVVQDAIVALQGKDWTQMTAEEKIRTAIDKHYTEMAYYLYSRNYVDLSGAEKTKADTCRTALEAKLAGTAGKLSAVETFWSDVVAGRIKLSNLASPQAQASPQLEGRNPRQGVEAGLAN